MCFFPHPPHSVQGGATRRAGMAPKPAPRSGPRRISSQLVGDPTTPRPTSVATVRIGGNVSAADLGGPTLGFRKSLTGPRRLSRVSSTSTGNNGSSSPESPTAPMAAPPSASHSHLPAVTPPSRAWVGAVRFISSVSVSASSGNIVPLSSPYTPLRQSGPANPQQQQQPTARRVSGVALTPLSAPAKRDSTSDQSPSPDAPAPAPLSAGAIPQPAPRRLPNGSLPPLKFRSGVLPLLEPSPWSSQGGEGSGTSPGESATATSIPAGRSNPFEDAAPERLPRKTRSTPLEPVQRGASDGDDGGAAAEAGGRLRNPAGGLGGGGGSSSPQRVSNHPMHGRAGGSIGNLVRMAAAPTGPLTGFQAAALNKMRAPAKAEGRDTASTASPHGAAAAVRAGGGGGGLFTRLLTRTASIVAQAQPPEPEPPELLGGGDAKGKGGKAGGVRFFPTPPSE